MTTTFSANLRDKRPSIDHLALDLCTLPMNSDLCVICWQLPLLQPSLQGLNPLFPCSHYNTRCVTATGDTCRWIKGSGVRCGINAAYNTTIFLAYFSIMTDVVCPLWVKDKIILVFRLIAACYILWITQEGLRYSTLCFELKIKRWNCIWKSRLSAPAICQYLW